MTVAVLEFSRCFLEEGGGLVAISGLQLLPSHEILCELGIDLFLVLFIWALRDVAISLLVDGQLIN